MVAAAQPLPACESFLAGRAGHGGLVLSRSGPQNCLRICFFAMCFYVKFSNKFCVKKTLGSEMFHTASLCGLPELNLLCFCGWWQEQLLMCLVL